MSPESAKRFHPTATPRLKAVGATCALAVAMRTASPRVVARALTATVTARRAPDAPEGVKRKVPLESSSPRPLREIIAARRGSAAAGLATPKPVSITTWDEGRRF